MTLKELWGRFQETLTQGAGSELKSRRRSKAASCETAIQRLPRDHRPHADGTYSAPGVICQCDGRDMAALGVRAAVPTARPCSSLLGDRGEQCRSTGTFGQQAAFPDGIRAAPASASSGVEHVPLNPQHPPGPSTG